MPNNVNAAASYGIRDLVSASLSSAQRSGQIGAYTANDVFSWNDGFAYQATGIPSVTFSATGLDYWQRYHTDYDSLDTLDFPTLEPVLAAEADVALDLDRLVTPYAFDGRLANSRRESRHRYDRAVRR